jgi:hypothetical protein
VTVVEQLHVHDRAIYRITVLGFLDARWSDWLDGLHIVSIDGVGATAQTVLEGNLVDQSALIGVLGMLQGLGLPVIGVEYLGQDHIAADQRKEP